MPSRSIAKWLRDWTMNHQEFFPFGRTPSLQWGKDKTQNQMSKQQWEKLNHIWSIECEIIDPVCSVLFENKGQPLAIQHQAILHKVGYVKQGTKKKDIFKPVFKSGFLLNLFWHFSLASLLGTWLDYGGVGNRAWQWGLWEYLGEFLHSKIFLQRALPRVG